MKKKINCMQCKWWQTHQQCWNSNWIGKKEDEDVANPICEGISYQPIKLEPAPAEKAS